MRRKRDKEGGHMPKYKDYDKRIGDWGNYMTFFDHFVRRVVGCKHLCKPR